MRIDLVTTELAPGGAELCLVNLALYLSKNGFCCRVIGLGVPPTDPQLIERLHAQHIQTVTLGCGNPKMMIRARKQLRALVKDNQPQIVQSFLFHANVLASTVYWHASIPQIAGFRVSEPGRFRHWIERRIAKRYQTAVCVSNSVKQWAMQNRILEEDKLIVIPNGIKVPETLDYESLAHEHPITSDIARSKTVLVSPHGPPVLLFAGRLHAQKGVDRLMQHADRILSQLPLHHLVLCGEGPLRQSLEASSYQHSDRIHFVGWQPDLKPWLVRCEMLLLPTRYEGMPNVVLEAMAMGKPCVVTRVDGVAELLGNSEAQVKTSFQDWLEALAKLANSPELRAKCGLANFERARDQFQLEKQMARYAELYRRTCPS